MKYKTDLKLVRDKAWELLECLRAVKDDEEFNKTLITMYPGTETYQAYVESVESSCDMFIERVGYIHKIVGKWVDAAPGKRKGLPPPRPEPKIPKIKPKVAKTKVDKPKRKRVK